MVWPPSGFSKQEECEEHRAIINTTSTKTETAVINRATQHETESSQGQKMDTTFTRRDFKGSTAQAHCIGFGNGMHEAATSGVLALLERAIYESHTTVLTGHRRMYLYYNLNKIRGDLETSTDSFLCSSYYL